MTTIILAGGYGRRLAPLTDYHNKSLLPVADKPIIDRIIEKLPPSKIIISTNKRFAQDFEKWTTDKSIEIIVEETRKEEEKLGAVGGILYVIKNKGLKESVLLVNGDNIFDFSLNDVPDPEFVVNLLYDIKDPEKIKGKYGNAQIENGFIKGFLEKPQNPVSSLVSTGIYYFPVSVFSLIEEFYSSDNPDRDNIGSLLKWLMYERGLKIKAAVKKGVWIDIGSRESYIYANKVVSGKDSFISPSAKLINSSVSSSVILENSRISDSKIEGCVIDEDCFIENSHLKDKIIGKGSKIIKQVESNE